MTGSGTHLKHIIESWLGVQSGGCGGCKELLEEMDKKGPQWCRDNIDSIVPKIRHNAKRNPKWVAKILANIPGIKAPIYAIVFLAISKAEADLEAEKKEQQA